MAEPASKLPQEDQPDIRPNLKAIEGGGEGDGVPKANLQDASAVTPQQLHNAEDSGGYYNPSGDQSGAKDSKQSEGPQNQNKAAETSGDEGLYNPQERASHTQRLKKRAKGFLKKKWLVGGVLGGGVGAFIIAVLFLVFIGPYKLVNFAEHVADRQFARVTREMAQSTENITEEQMGLDTLDPAVSSDASLLAKIKAAYDVPATKVGDAWSKLDKYRPSKVISNFKADNTLSLEYKGSKLTSVTVNGVTAEVERGGLKGLIPGYTFVGNVKLANQIGPAIASATNSDEVAPIIRGAVARGIRQDLGIGWVAWQIGKYAGKSDSEADAQAQIDSYNAEMKGTPDTNSEQLSNVQDEEKQARAEQDKAVSSIQAAEQSVADSASGGEPAGFWNTLNDFIKTSQIQTMESFLKGLIGWINPVYTYAGPVCAFYDASLSHSGPTIDAQNQAAERSAIWLQTAAGQEKNGYNVTGEAVSGTDFKIGDITKSNAEKAASGIPVDTSQYISPEASPSGTYSSSPTGGVSGTLDSIINTMGGSGLCPIVSNMWIGLAVAIPILGTGFVKSFIELGADQMANQTFTDIAKTLMNKLFGKLAENKKALGGAVAITSATVAAALLGREMAMSQSGANLHPLAIGASYDDASIDSGMNRYAQQVSQQQFYGAPLQDSELSADNAANTQTLAVKESQKSLYDRYFALSDPYSLLSRFGIMASGLISRSPFASLFNFGHSLINPFNSLGSAFASIFSHSAFADTTITSDNTDYGHVQFGYTRAEQALMNTDSYQLLPNQKILDDSGEEDAIQATYGECFDGSVSIGTMLQNGLIVRDDSGNVVANKGLCSPNNLGPHNTDPNSPCGSQGCGDLVFRWRVANNYNNTLAQLADEQTVTATDTTSAPAPVSASGYQNPFRDVKNLGTSRVDEGVDFTGSGPVYAIGNGTVVGPQTNSGWPGGTFIVYQLTDGPAKGKYVYMSENCQNINPSVHSGATVSSSTRLCDMVDASPHIETGWADGSAIGAALARSVYNELPSGQSYATAYGQNFRELLDSLSVSVSSCYDFPGAPLSGSPLPSSWPTWTANPATTSGSQSCG